MGYFADGKGVDGSFKEIAKGHDFQFRKTENEWAIENGFLYEINCGGLDNREIRFANIKKTVAHIVVDEDGFGKPVTEKWCIRMYPWSVL